MQPIPVLNLWFVLVGLGGEIPQDGDITYQVVHMLGEMCEEVSHTEYEAHWTLSTPFGSLHVTCPIMMGGRYARGLFTYEIV